MLDEFAQSRLSRMEVDGVDVLHWQAWIEAGLGEFDRSVFIRIFPAKREWQTNSPLS